MTDQFEYYVIERDGDTHQVITVTIGNDPLHGRGTWNYAAGPFKTIEEADKEADKLYRPF